MNLLESNPAGAASLFEHAEWRGVGKYRAQDYEKAAEAFKQHNSPRSQYNLGNALAKSGDLQESLKTYESLLKRENLSKKLKEDAQFNRDLIKQLLEQQAQQQPAAQDQKQQTDKNNNSPDQTADKMDQQHQSQSSDDPAAASDQTEQKPTEAPAQAGTTDGENRRDRPQTNKQTAENAENQEEQHPQQQQAINVQDRPLSEDQQATEQWLRRIPDDPAGLLRRKLIQTHRNLYPEIKSGSQAW